MKKKLYSDRNRKFSGLIKLLKVMKLTVLLLLVSVFGVLANKSYSQNKMLNLSMQDATVKEVLNGIEKQSEFYFLYSENLIDVKRKIDITLVNQKIDQALKLIFKGTDVDYSIRDRIIVLTPQEIPKKDLEVLAQQKSVPGKVTDSDGQPLPGVTVVVKGTTQGTVTNADGNYSLSNIPEDATLVFSFVGMRTQEVVVGSQTRIDVVMEKETIGIEEVVAVGYGTQKKVNLTGAVSVVTAKALDNRPITSTAQGLQGALPNLNINFESGDPTNQDVDYNIRGFESINGGSPYILVDGVPMNIEQINPKDIESVTVLKDASASAIYGGKAAFGVILVTTKQGEGKDKIKINYSHETAFSSPILKGYDPVDNSYDQAIYRNLMNTNDGLSPAYNDVRLAGIKAYYENPESAPEYEIYNGDFYYYGYTNFKDELITIAPSYKHNLSISGGTEKSKYYVSFGNFKKEGNLKLGNDSYVRNNILVKLTQNVADWISFDEKITVNMVKTDKPHDYGSMFYSVSAVALTSSTQAIKFPENDPDFPDLGGQYFENTVAYMEKGGRTFQRSYDTWLTSGINLKPVKHLNLRGEISYNYYNRVFDDAATTIDFVKTTGFGTGSNFTNGYTTPSYANASFGYRRSYIFNTYAEYERNDLGSHYVKAMIGFNQQENFDSGVSATGYELITPYVPAVNASTGERTGNAYSSNSGLMGVFYRMNYIYKDKYLMELSGRYDGTSRFPKEDRFGFFPSGSVGWRISQEPFMQVFAWLDNLKVRASYGSLGNQQLSYQGNDLLYPYISSLGVTTSTFMILDNQSYPLNTTLPQLVSSSLTWETVETKDIGLDFSLFNQRLDGSFDYYIRSTKNMLMRKEYPELLGATPPYENAASLDTKGWEFTLSWRDKISKDFSYGLKFALWDSKTTITKFYNPTGSLSTYYEGQVIGEIWGLETYGLFQSLDEVNSAPSQSSIYGGTWYPGDVRYVDQLTADSDGDGIMDAGDNKITRGVNTLADHGDLKIIGNNMPRYSYSFTLDLNYKNWNFSAFFQGIGKRDYAPNPNFGSWFPWNTNGMIKKSDIQDFWREDNPDGYWYRAESSNAQEKNKTPQTRWLQNAAYLRLKSVVLSYKLPSNLINKVALSNAEVFVSGQNLWEHSNFIFNRDPEQNTGNNLTINSSFLGPLRVAYPFQRTISVGVNLTF